MLVTYLLLAIVATAQATPIKDTEEYRYVPSDLCEPDIHHLLPHEYDCTKFYYCEYGYRRLDPTNCAAGTHFSYIHQACIHPILANCNLPGSPPTEEDVTQTTPASSSTQAPTTTTTQSTTTTTTVAPTTTTTEAPTTTTTQAPTTTTTQAPTTTTTQAPTTTEATSDPCDEPSDILPNGCPVDFHEHKLLPHETYCHKFYYCVFGEKVERNCSIGTYFNYEKQVCDWPRNVNCTNPGDEDLGSGGDCGGNGEDSGSCGGNENDNDNGGNPGGCIGGESDGGSCGGDGGSGFLPNGCPADFHIHHLLPHETNCSRFYYCVFGEKVERECAPGTHFNPVIQVCDWPWNAGCENNDNGGCNGNDNEGSSCGTQAPTTITTQAPVTTTIQATTSTDSSEPCEEPSEFLPNGCPADFHVHHLLPHETNCSRFYYCVFGEKVERECAPETHFNPVIQACDWPWLANCTLEGVDNGCNSPTTCPPSTATTEATTTTNTQAPTTTTTQVVTTTTTQIPTTTAQAPTTTSSQAPVTTTTQPSTTTSQAPTSTDSSEPCEEPSEFLPNGCPADFDVHHLLPHETNCSRFYYCVFGEKVERECAPGTHFNPVIQACDWPWLANCTLEDVDNDCNSPTTCPPSTATTEAATTTNTQAPTTTTTQVVTTTTTQIPTTTAQAPTTTSSQAPVTTTTQPSTTTSQAPTSTDSSEPCEEPSEFLPNGCPADFHVHHLLPHETNCSRFYYCVFGEKVERECAPGTHFNPVIQACDWPWLANCTLEGVDNGCNSPTTCPPSTATTEATTTTNTQAPTTTTTNQAVSTSSSQAPVTTTTQPSTTTSQAPTSTDSSEPCEEPSEFLPNGCPADFDVHHLLPHETNCSRFYYCVFGEKVERECAPGTHFNPVIQACDWPWLANCTLEDVDNDCNSPTTCPPSTATTEAATTTNTQAPTTTTTQVVTTTTTQIPTTTAQAPTTTSSQAPVTTTTQPSTTTSQAPTSTDSSEPCEEPSEFLPNGCPADFHVHHLLPHETNCSRFYYCVFGEKVERECAPGTHFNPVIQACDWPWLANCTLEGVDNGCNSPTTCPPSTATTEATTTTNTQAPTTTTTNQAVSTSSSQAPVTTTTQPSTTTSQAPTSTDSSEPCEEPSEFLPNGCPADFHVHHLLPHETNCSRFYYCVFGEKVERECAPGTHFNPVIQACDWPWLANCTLEGVDNGCNSPTTCPPSTATTEAATITNTQAPTTTTTNQAVSTTSSQAPVTTTTQPSTTTSQAPTSTDSSEPCEEPSEFLPNGCPADFDVHHLLPHETNCSRFYYCVFGEKVERECAPGTHFNPVIQACDWPWLANCTLEDVDNDCNSPTTCPPSTATTEAATTTNTQAPTTTTTQVVTTTTTQVPTTTAQAPTTTSSQAPVTTTTQPSTTTSQAPTSTDSSEPCEEPSEFLPNGCPADFDVHHLLPHETNCSRFYYCVFGEKVERECAPGTHFNPVIQACDWPWLANCTLEDVDNDCNSPTTCPPSTATTEAITTTNTHAPTITTTQAPTTTTSQAPITTTTHAPTTITTQAPTTTTTQAPTTTTTQVPITTTTEGTDNENNENDDRCKTDCNILPWAHDTDCDKFWICDGEKAVLVTCSEGLHFNPSTGTCDFMCNVNCIREEIQSTAEIDGIKLFLPWDKVDSNMQKLINKAIRH